MFCSIRASRLESHLNRTFKRLEFNPNSSHGQGLELINVLYVCVRVFVCACVRACVCAFLRV